MTRTLADLKPTKPLVAVVLLIGTIQSLFYAYTCKLMPDQIQMLWRGVQLAHKGVWTHYGPAVTGGGFVPGSLSTALVGWPLMIWDSPWASEGVVLLFHLLSLYFMNDLLKSYFSPAQRFVFLCLFWLTPWRASKVVLFNPSYLFFPAALHLWTINKLNQRPTFWLTFWHIFAIGFAFQLHASSIILAFITLYLYLRKQVKPNWLGVIAGVGFVIVTLIPFYLEMRGHKELAPIVQKEGDWFYGRGFLYVFPLLKGLFYLPRYTSAIFPSYIFTDTSMPWIGAPWLRTVAESGMVSVQYLFGITTFLFSTWALIWVFKKALLQQKPFILMSSFLDNYIVATILAVLVISGISPTSYSHWHLFLTLPVAFTFLVQFIFKNWANHPQALRVWLIVISYFVFYNSSAVFISDYHSFKDNVHTKFSTIK